MNIKIRKFEQSDREAVRKISCDTALKGSPIDSVLSDRILAGDLMTRYYTDFEPESLWVSENEGQVMGYLTGCLDTRIYNKTMSQKIIPNAFINALFRGSIFSRDPSHGSGQAFRLIGASYLTWKKGGTERHIPYERYPAHLHVNVLKEFRSQKIGQKLIAIFIDYIKEKGIKGVHLSVREDNAPACAFFKKSGFTEISRHPFVVPTENNSYFFTNIVAYGMDL